MEDHAGSGQGSGLGVGMGGSLCPVPSPGLRGSGPVGASETGELAEGPHMHWDLGEDGSPRPAESFITQESPVTGHVM